MTPIHSLSDFLGYASITCWLGAQFPQVIENHRRRSVDGLAWPFLANWLLGDVSNLVGCILTHQLPFQTYLAIYFCFVDLTLVGQYIYYRSTSKPTPHFPARARTSSTATLTRRISIERHPAHYRALSNVAANVAAAAALAAQEEERPRWYHDSVDSRHTLNADDRDFDDDEVDEGALARLADSFHSEGGRSVSRKKVSWSQERPVRGGSLGRSHAAAISPMSRTHPSVLGQTSPVLGGTDEFANRGRPLSRELPVVEEPEDEWTGGSTAQRRSSRASRKGAGMVFLGAWALFSVGTLAGSKRGLATGSAVRMGRVLTMDEVAFVRPPPTTQDNILHFTATPDVRGSDATLFFNDLRFADDIPPSGPDEQGPSTDYVIGRISAWICTTLYLTSRLPQIWKNYVRKSVEGLSISLFVFAFLGNFLYVTSILTSPNLSLPEPQASAFLRESIPYILGSGGTLMFDITIVTQSFLYRPKAHLRGRRASRTFEEEEGLLGAGATGSDDPITPSRRRNLTQSEVRD